MANERMVLMLADSWRGKTHALDCEIALTHLDNGPRGKGGTYPAAAGL